MKKLILTVIILLSFSFNTTGEIHDSIDRAVYIEEVKNIEPELTHAKFRWVTRWKARVDGTTVNGGSVYGYALDYSTRRGAINRADDECSIRGGCYRTLTYAYSYLIKVYIRHYH